MKKFSHCCLWSIITISLVFIGLASLTKITERKSSVIQYKQFFDAEENFDVLYVGSSHVIDDIYPVEIWNDYGITSYNLGGHSNVIATSYWILKNALDYTTPQLVVIDGYLLPLNFKTSPDNYSSIHNSFDAFPISATKIKAVYDLLNDDISDEWIERGNISIDEIRTPIGLLWDFSLYHDRWSQLTSNDINTNYSVEMGAETRIGVYPHDELSFSDSVWEEETYGTIYLEKCIQELQDADIDVLLIFLPANEGQQIVANRMAEIADEYNVDYINFLNNGVINPLTDFSDQAGHLNPSGARKVSQYLGQYISDNYEIADQRENEQYAFWKEAEVSYFEYKIKNLRSQSNIVNYLMLLNDAQLSVEINTTVDGTNAIYNGDYGELFRNIGSVSDELEGANYVEANELMISESRQNVPDYWITVKNVETGETIDRVSVFGQEIIHE